MLTLPVPKYRKKIGGGGKIMEVFSRLLLLNLVSYPFHSDYFGCPGVAK